MNKNSTRFRVYQGYVHQWRTREKSIHGAGCIKIRLAWSVSEPTKPLWQYAISGVIRACALWRFRIKKLRTSFWWEGRDYDACQRLP